MSKDLMEKMDALFENASFEAAFADCKDEDSLLRLFSENGIEIDQEELQDLLREISQSDDLGELGEDALEAVAGGGKTWERIKKGLKKLIKRMGGSLYNGVINGNPKSAFQEGKKFAEYMDKDEYAKES